MRSQENGGNRRKNRREYHSADRPRLTDMKNETDTPRQRKYRNSPRGFADGQDQCAGNGRTEFTTMV